MNENQTHLRILNNSSIQFLVKARQIHIDKISIYTILFILSSIGNTASFVALLNMNKQRNTNNSKSRIRLLFLHLCIGDLMVIIILSLFFFILKYFKIFIIIKVTFIHMPLEIAWAYTDSWLAGDIICKLMLSLRTFGFYLSSSVLITITIDRYYVILYPMKMEKINKLSKILLYVCWIFSFISSIPQVFN